MPEPDSTATDRAGVDAFLRTVDPARVAELEALRELILSADERVREGVKWNSVSFRLDDWFATLNLHRGKLLLVLHRGAKSKGTPRPELADPAGLLEWRGDDRALVDCDDPARVKAQRARLKAIVKQWIAALDA